MNWSRGWQSWASSGRRFAGLCFDEAKSSMKKQSFEAPAVILAGGRGTRFWPRSRTRTPKQFLNIIGQRTMFQQTVARIAPLFPASRIWTVTNQEQAREAGRGAPGNFAARNLSETAGRDKGAGNGETICEVGKISMERGNVFLPRGNVPRELEALPAAILLDAAPPGRLHRNGALRARAGPPVCEARKHFDRLCRDGAGRA